MHHMTQLLGKFSPKRVAPIGCEEVRLLREQLVASTRRADEALSVMKQTMETQRTPVPVRRQIL